MAVQRKTTANTRAKNVGIASIQQKLKEEKEIIILKGLPDKLMLALKQPIRRENMPKTEFKKMMFEQKELLWEFEQENLQYMVMYFRGAKWWQMGDRSMLLYKYFIGPKLKRKVQRCQDTDFNKKRWKFGYTTVVKLQALVTEARLVGCKLVAKTPNMLVLKLEKPVQEEDFAVWANVEEEKLQRFNTLVVPKNVYPKVLSLAGELSRMVVDKVSNLTMPQQKYFGDDGAKLASWISYNAVRMANGRIGVKEYFDLTLEKIDELNDWMGYVRKFNKFDIDTCLRIVQKNRELKEEVELRKMQLEKKSPKTGGKSDRSEVKDVDEIVSDSADMSDTQGSEEEQHEA